MKYWYTFAIADYGTLKMRFKEKMTKEQAEMLGKKYCEENNITCRNL